MNAYPVLWNGELIDDGARAIPAWDRSFHFGDGLFETLRVVDRHPLFLEEHLMRTKRGMECLGIEVPQVWNVKGMAGEISRFMERIGASNGRVRITVSRKGGGAYTPWSDEANYLIERTGEGGACYEQPEKMLRVELFSGMVKHPGPLSSFKCTSAPLYVLAQRWAKKNGYDEALIRDPSGNVLESATSNIFLISGHSVKTPAVEDGCVDGVMRKVVFDLLQLEGWDPVEAPIREEELLDAEELILTNAVQGVRAIGSFRDRRYFKDKAARLVERLNERAFS